MYAILTKGQSEQIGKRVMLLVGLAYSLEYPVPCPPVFAIRIVFNPAISVKDHGGTLFGCVGGPGRYSFMAWVTAAGKGGPRAAHPLCEFEKFGRISHNPWGKFDVIEDKRQLQPVAGL
jgi:hypothetical protein